MAEGVFSVVLFLKDLSNLDLSKQNGPSIIKGEKEVHPRR